MSTGIQIFIICRTCEDINKQMLGMPGFDVLNPTEYESLTDAWQHLLETQHRLELEGRPLNSSS